MDLTEVKREIEAAIPNATAEVRRARHEGDDEHLAATVVSPAFADESLVDRHQRVYDAVDEYMTAEIHALEVETHTPEERE